MLVVAFSWGDYKLITGNAIITEPIEEKYATAGSDYLWTQPAEWATEGIKKRRRILGTDCGLSSTDICLFNMRGGFYFRSM